MTLYHFKLDLLICALFDAYLFVDLVALSNGLHGSVQMDSVALFSWIGRLRHHGILKFFPNLERAKIKKYYLLVQISVSDSGSVFFIFFGKLEEGILF